MYALYYQKTGERLQNLNIAWAVCADSNCNHQTAINEYYNNLINVLNDAATESIPLISGNSIKPYWSEHLQQLQDESIQIHNTWVDCDKPSE